jgi:hypothetical protein
MRNKENNRTEAVAKGYRLKPETHELVNKLQKQIRATKDEIISRACKMYYNSVVRSQKNKLNRNNK